MPRRRGKLAEPRQIPGRDVWAVDFTVEAGAGQIRVYGASYQDAQDKMLRTLADAAKGVPVSRERRTVGEYLAHWIDEAKPGTLRETSRVRYRSDIEHHLIPHLGRVQLVRLTSAQVRSALAAMRRVNGKPLAPRSVQRIRATLRVALNDAIADDLLARNVAEHIRLPAAPKYLPPVLEVDDAKRLIDAARGTRFEAFVAVGLAFGLRLGECLGLQWSDVSRDYTTLSISRQLQNLPGQRILVTPKTGRTVRTLRLPAATAAALRRHRATLNQLRLRAPTWQDHDLILPRRDGHPWAHQAFRNGWFSFLKAARLPTWNPHDLRRSCVSILLAYGVPPAEVMALVGHETMGMTMETYNRVTGHSGTAQTAVDALFGGTHETHEGPGETAGGTS